MEPTIIAALVSSIGAIVVAALSAIRAARADRQLEDYRYALGTLRLQEEFTREQVVKLEEFTREQLEKRADIFGKACTEIQTLRDALRYAQLSDGQDYHVIGKVIEASGQLRDFYGSVHPAVPPLERRLLHTVKNLALEHV